MAWTLTGLTFACATSSEERAASGPGSGRPGWASASRRGVPAGDLVSFGVAGGLDGLEIGTVIDATRIVDEHGTVLWEGRVSASGARRRGRSSPSTGSSTTPAERRRLHEATGADAVDMESGVLAATGRLRGCVRAISDTPDAPARRRSHGRSRRTGARALSGFLERARARALPATVRALGDVRRALTALGRCGR